MRPIAIMVLAAAIMALPDPLRTPHAQGRACPVATAERAKALAERAAAYLKRHGPEWSFARFMDPAGGFIDGDLYVFVFDAAGVLRASGGWPRTVGSRATVGAAARGVVARMFRIANSKGRGWVHYSWYSPCSGRMEPKMSYVIKVGDFIVGVGAYKKVGV